MKVFHILFCFIFLAAQQDGDSGRVNAETYRRVEGENITFKCNFKIPGSRRFFCKGKCENGNILIETTDDAYESGRYSIRYVRNSFWESDIMYVNISQLKMSDSGWYRCSLDRTLIPCNFEIIVTEASNTLTPDFILKPVSTSTFLQSASTTTTTTTTTTQSLDFGSGGSTPPSASTELMKHSETPAGPGADELLYVIPALVVMIALLSAALLIFYKKNRTTQPKGPPVEVDYTDIMQTSRLYEDTREGDRLSSSPAVEASLIYAYPNSCQRNRAETLELYSLLTSPQNKAEYDLNEVNYAEVDFSHIPATNSAPCGKAAEVVYSTPLMNSSHVTDVSPPLYSTVRKQ